MFLSENLIQACVRGMVWFKVWKQNFFFGKQLCLSSFSNIFLKAALPVDRLSRGLPGELQGATGFRGSWKKITFLLLQ